MSIAVPRGVSGPRAITIGFFQRHAIFVRQGRLPLPAKRAGRWKKTMATEGRRPERVAEVVLRELSQMLLRDLKDPRLRGVTLTGVRMADDLRHGRVFFSHLEGHPRAREAVAGFQSASGFIRRKIGRELGLRFAPELDFEFDSTGERAARIDALLREARKD
jgi:ribosome-binding factor A